ncbi:hypothetical protein C8J57DRAFT_178774 [Mycena rebaudengoi]|nr:hypothetical protein C8J57DRAFT_178774 [Mycena rebaudengoi]
MPYQAQRRPSNFEASERRIRILLSRRTDTPLRGLTGDAVAHGAIADAPKYDPPENIQLTHFTPQAGGGGGGYKSAFITRDRSGRSGYRANATLTAIVMRPRGFRIRRFLRFPPYVSAQSYSLIVFISTSKITSDLPRPLSVLPRLHLLIKPLRSSLTSAIFYCFASRVGAFRHHHRLTRIHAGVSRTLPGIFPMKISGRDVLVMFLTTRRRSEHAYLDRGHLRHFFICACHPQRIRRSS